MNRFQLNHELVILNSPIILAILSSLIINDVEDMYKAYTFLFLPLKIIIFSYYNYHSIDEIPTVLRYSFFIFLQFLFNSIAAGSKGESSKYNYIKYDIIFSLFLIN